MVAAVVRVAMVVLSDLAMTTEHWSVKSMGNSDELCAGTLAIERACIISHASLEAVNRRPIARKRESDLMRREIAS